MKKKKTFKEKYTRSVTEKVSTKSKTNTYSEKTGYDYVAIL